MYTGLSDCIWNFLLSFRGTRDMYIRIYVCIACLYVCIWFLLARGRGLGDLQFEALVRFDWQVVVQCGFKLECHSCLWCTCIGFSKRLGDSSASCDYFHALICGEFLRIFSVNHGKMFRLKIQEGYSQVGDRIAFCSGDSSGPWELLDQWSVCKIMVTGLKLTEAS